jgi:hypothetical protein
MLSVKRVSFITALLIAFCASASAQVKALPSDPTMKLQGLDGKV